MHHTVCIQAFRMQVCLDFTGIVNLFIYLFASIFVALFLSLLLTRYNSECILFLLYCNVSLALQRTLASSAPTTTTRYLFTNNNSCNMYFMSLFVHFQTHVSKCSIENRIFSVSSFACAYTNHSYIITSCEATREKEKIREKMGAGEMVICTRNRITLPDDIRSIILLSANA